VRDDPGHGIGPFAFLMYEVYPEPIHRGFVVMEGVEPLLLGSLVKTGAPVFHQRLRLAQVNAVVPVRTADLPGTAGRLQAEVQIIPHRIGHL